MFKKKNKLNDVQSTTEETVFDTENVDLDVEDVESIKKFYAGARTLKDYIAPPAFYRGDET